MPQRGLGGFANHIGRLPWGTPSPALLDPTSTPMTGPRVCHRADSLRPARNDVVLGIPLHWGGGREDSFRQGFLMAGCIPHSPQA